MSDKNFSDEFINAFADDQLTPEEKSRVYPIFNGDPDLNRRVCEVRKIRDLIQLAYKEPPAAPKRRRKVTSSLGTRVAAVLLLTVGGVIGWAFHQAFTVPPDISASTGTPVSASPSPMQALAPQDSETRIILHLSRGDVEHMREALDAADNLLEYYEKAGQRARIELIANAEGLNLLRADTSPFAARISEMKRRHDNITFAACKSTIDLLQQQAPFGFQAQLLPEAVIIESGVAQIILLQQQGWAYIQV